MTLLDIVFAVTILISAGLAMKRGFVREFITLVALEIAGALALLIYHQVLVPADIRLFGTMLGSFVTFLVALIVLMRVGRRVSDAINADAAVLNRLLGGLLGLARGVVLLVFGLLAVEWLVDPAARPSWITGAMSAGWVREAGQWLATRLPGGAEIFTGLALGAYLSLFISLLAVLIGRRPVPPRA